MEIFEKFKILNRKSDSIRPNYQNSIKFHTTDYKIVKVCQNCYIIYCLLIKELEEKPIKSINLSHFFNFK